ncbi:T6SS phospholipase effector Tle1-like catalytic domain-containing protein [Pseudoduganella violaceinigra]|uniref:T6SS phospholipase effector Tle1-like catalytic domain-containing protein n=1 Tax=Pseudoduganella violaceinigra TaxID=246602 RepID=UPI0003F54CD6|nr:DUF2235 domain-containing protein [Pseudoduganella violaceinigra]
MSANVQPAKNPNLSNTRGSMRPLGNAEAMQRAKAIALQQGTQSSPKCCGHIFAGIFFDGTGNNEYLDYQKVRTSPEQHKQSNVVRLFHTYPDGKIVGTDKYYATYIPGVGTPFDGIRDSGGTLGTAASWNGEPRIIWALLQVVNYVSRFLTGNLLIGPEDANKIANNLGGIGSTALERNFVLSGWVNKVKTMVAGRPSGISYPEQINLSVFGFSRGAAEARAFVNWLYALCEKKGELFYFAGIPLHLTFLGIFDTVASVGVAAGFSNGIAAFEGHQSWANDNMQINQAVQNCLHIVAAHEVRATFPLDSVRVDGKYPANVREYIYPGAHSDVGGGYSRKAQGKTDELARIAGFEMYCAALAAGVPLRLLGEMILETKMALIPSKAALDAFNSYYQHAKITEAPVEEMARQHMAHYFTYRYQARKAPGTHPQAGGYYTRKFYKAAPTETKFLRDSQQRFIAVLANVAHMIDYLMKNEKSYDFHLPQPYQVAATGSTFTEKLMTGSVLKYSYILKKRLGAGDDDRDNGQADIDAHKILDKLEQWRKWLADNASPFLVDADAPERDVLGVVQSLSEAPQPMEMVNFFDHWVHDSIAGIQKDNVDEFLLNGIGIAKFRRIYFGDQGDSIVKETAENENEVEWRAAKAQRRQLKQWALDKAEYDRMR